MSVLVVVTYGGHDPYRERARDLVLQHYGLEFPDWSGHLATSDVEPFPKASLVNHAVRGNLIYEGYHGQSSDVVVLNDADSLVAPAQIREAVRLAREAPGVVFAFTEYVRLSKAGSSAVRGWDDCHLVDADMVIANSGSHGCLAIRRECFLGLGGLDEEYGLMYEDLDFDNRAAERWPLRRVAGPLYHLWHPRPEGHELVNRERYRMQWGGTL